MGMTGDGSITAAALLRSSLPTNEKANSGRAIVVALKESLENKELILAALIPVANAKRLFSLIKDAEREIDIALATPGSATTNIKRANNISTKLR